MILPLELLCQVVLAYESFKALKAAAAPRKRRQALQRRPAHGADGLEDGNAAAAAFEESSVAPRLSTYAANKRKRAMKVILRAWLLYALAVPAERLLDYSLGWILPFYSSFRTVTVLAFLFYHKITGDIAYTNFIQPFLRPREPSLDWLFSWLNEILDVSCYIILLIFRQTLAVIWVGLTPLRQVWQRGQTALRHIRRNWQTPENHSLSTDANVPEEIQEEDESRLDTRKTTNRQDMSKTPRRSKTKRKPRYSEIATPYVPGHLIADASIYPPVQPRLHPAERSLDDLPAFQEALDRAQAAFYEVTSPELRPADPQYPISGEEGDPFLPPGKEASTSSRHLRSTRQARSSNGFRDDLQPPLLHHSVEVAFKIIESQQEEADNRTEAETVRQPSAKALGKRRQTSNPPPYEENVDAQDKSPAKIAKVKASDDVSRQHRDKKRPAKVNGTALGIQRSASSRLPTRAPSRTGNNNSAGVPRSTSLNITKEGQLAREAVLAARRRK